MIVVVAAAHVTLMGKPAIRYEPHVDARSRGRGQGLMFYPDARTTDGMNRWRGAWRRHGSPYIDGPIEIELHVVRVRPASHLLVDGSLSATGRQFPIPPRPDCSNTLKLVEDALKHLAFGDDALIARATSSKAYGAPERSLLVIRPWVDERPYQSTIDELA